MRGVRMPFTSVMSDPRPAPFADTESVCSFSRKLETGEGVGVASHLRGKGVGAEQLFSVVPDPRPATFADTATFQRGDLTILYLI